MWARIGLYTNNKGDISENKWSESEWDKCFTRITKQVKLVFGERTGHQGDYDGVSGNPNSYDLSVVSVNSIEEGISLVMQLCENLKGTPDELIDFSVMFPREHKCYWGHEEWSFC